MSYNLYDGYGHKTEMKNLFAAIQYKSLEGVKHFLKAGVNPDITDASGYTPLARAVEKNFANVVEYLINENVDVCRVGKYGKTPLSIATEKQNLPLIKMLVDNGAKYNIQFAFLIAIQTTNLDIVKYLHEKGAHINFSYKNGHTPLTMAISTGNTEIVRYLLDNNANIRVLIDDETNSPVLNCIKNKKIDMLLYLIELGVDLDRAGECGYTPLTRAVDLENYKMVKDLVENGAEINNFDNNQKTALAIAASKGLFTICCFLLDSGANIQLAKTEIDEYANWCEDFAVYLALVNMKIDCRETGHEEA